MRKLTMDEVTFEVKVEQEVVPLKGNVQESGDDEADARAENEVQEALDMGNIWAWSTVTVIARWNGFEGRDRLGCCSYDSEEDFKQDEYYPDMKKEALDDLNRVISDTTERLRPLSELDAYEKCAVMCEEMAKDVRELKATVAGSDIRQS